MKSINIALPKDTYKLLEDMIGRMFVKISCNKFIYSNAVYGIVGIYVDKNVYKITNFVDVLDYYGKTEDVAVFKFEKTYIDDIESAVQDEAMHDIPIDKKIIKIDVVNENQVQYKNYKIMYDNWVTRGIIFYFDDGSEISFEKDIWFSEDIYVERGKNLLDTFASVDEFSDAWKLDDENDISEYTGTAKRKILSIV